MQTFDAVIRFPFDESLEFTDWQKTQYQWIWCDALFMSPPALAMASRTTGDRRYVDFMNRMWWKTTDYLYDKSEHLYHRDSRFFGRKIFWSRGNGWVLAGLARVLQNMPADYPDRPRYVALFREMAARIAGLQQSDGSWRTSLLRNGLLERATYEPVIRNGWAALVRAVHPDGMLGFVQRIGDQPGSTTNSTTEIYGSGAFLMAGSEVYRLAAGSQKR